MLRRCNGASSRSQSYHSPLRAAMSQFLPHQGLPLLSVDRRVRWTSRLLAMTAIFMAWSSCRTLVDRLAEARLAVINIYPTRRRPGRSQEGFSKALSQNSQAILAALSDYWRRCVRQVADGCWHVQGWVLFGVDGSTFNCPRTQANEKAFGGSGCNSNGGPQQLVTCLFHVASGLLWSWMRGPVQRNSERRQLRQMLPLLPANAMLLADAGFHGYDLIHLLLAHGSSFLMRVGNNVKLITKLGYAMTEWKDTVYLWPIPEQRRFNRRQIRKNPGGVRPPLVLRLIRLEDAKGRPVCLLTNVLQKSRLNDADAARIYRLRWGVEVMWRGLKQTMGHHKMLSGSPRRAASELDWAMAGLWMLQLISVKRMVESGQLPDRYSPASSLRVLRRAMIGLHQGRIDLSRELAAAVKDSYARHGSKHARNNMHKRPQTPPRQPVARMATRQEKQLAQRILNHPPPNSLAA
jgi:hypothetical protein